ncbi:MAG: RraA family protein [Rhodothermales bacterium]
MTDAEKYSFIKDQLYVAAVSDILDALDRPGQVMHHRLRPLLPDMRACGFVGRARTAQWIESPHIDEADPYGLEIDLMDSLQKDDVVVHSTDHGRSNAPWGELLSTIAKKKGCVGTVCDSQIRDCVRIVDMNFPVYYTGIRALDSMGRGRVVAIDVPIHCGDVTVHAGEIVFADFDGVVVIPRDIEDEVLRLAQEKVGKENQTREALLAGKSLREVWEQYGVL